MTPRKSQGFSLLDALVAVAISAVGFAGIYAAVNASRAKLDNAFERQQLNLLANEMVEAVGSAISEIDGFDQSLNDCSALDSNIGSSLSTEMKSMMNTWCNRLDGELGVATNAATRLLTVEDASSPDGLNFKVVSLQLSDAAGKTQVATKRIFYAP